MFRFFSMVMGLVISLLFVAGVSFASDLTDQSKSLGEAAKERSKRMEIPAKKAVAPIAPIDINSAPIDKLKSLPGVGEANAKKIIDGRPYANKAQLKSKKIIPDSVYDKISGLIVAKQPPKKPSK